MLFFIRDVRGKSLSQTTSFTFPFQQAQNIVFADRSLNVTDNLTGWIIHEFNANLGDVTGVTSAAKNANHTYELGWLVLFDFIYISFVFIKAVVQPFSCKFLTMIIDVDEVLERITSL